MHRSNHWTRRIRGKLEAKYA